MTARATPSAFDLAARESAVVVAHAADTFLVTGSDRVGWLQGLLTCDVASVVPGSGAWSLQLTRTGKILSVVDVVSDGERLLLGAAPGSGAGLRELLSGHLIMEDAEVTEGRTEYEWVRVHGPLSGPALAAARDAGAVAVGAIDWTGLGGGAVVARGSRMSVVRDALREATRAVEGDAADWERLRVERFVPEWGKDFDHAATPHEATLERRAVSWTKGCYLGQEVVCTLDMRGKLRRTLAALALDHEDVPPVGATVTDGQDVEVGSVTSAVYSGVLGAPLALARVAAKYASAGTRLAVGARPASVAGTPV